MATTSLSVREVYVRLRASQTGQLVAALFRGNVVTLLSRKGKGMGQRVQAHIV